MPSDIAAPSPKRRLLPPLATKRINPLVIASAVVLLAYAGTLAWLWLGANPGYVGPLQVIALSGEPTLSGDATLRASTDEPLEPLLLDETASALPLPLTLDPVEPRRSTDTHEPVYPGDATVSESFPETVVKTGALPLAPVPGLVANGPHGPLPVISASGERASIVYARPADLTAATSSLPKIALIVGGLGISETATRNAIENLPPEVTLSFAPYGRNLQQWIDRARDAGHEVLLELPLEPYDYPANDPGPYTLLTSLDAGENMDRLSWLMSRFTGYFGVTVYQGARFTAERDAMEPLFEALASRGVAFIDTGVSPRSVAESLARNQKLPWAKGTRTIDLAITPRSIDDALTDLEVAAQERGVSVGFGSGFPVTVERAAKWAEDLQDRGFVLVPVSHTTKTL
ncbi:MAG: divergent polysaccharide deacetylase family protein [Parvibaculum sp.]